MDLKNIEKQLYYKKIALIYYTNFMQRLSVKQYITKYTHLKLKYFDLKLFNKHFEAIQKGIY